MSITYRPDIDGLRALAVVSVVLFHADFDVFAGGFVGVDVFFVISGFLITGILFNDIEAKRFSIARFYERRCRRILPALFALLIATQIFGLFVLLPAEYVDLSKSALATIFFVSNIFFLRSGDNYFDPATETDPLLHTWSLAIEEQFYLVFPILLYFFQSSSRRTAFGMIAAICAVSFAAGVFTTRTDPSAAFYLAPTRAWELGIGGLLALWYGRWPATSWVREALAIGGIAAIAFAVFTFNRDTPFPGVAATLPALGAAAIIAAGKGGTTFAGRTLSLRPFVFVGLISYSLYLWHWPILAYLRVMTGNVELAPETAVVAILVATGLAVVSWATIERPFRRAPPIGVSRPLLFRSLASIATVLTGTVLFAWMGNGWPARFPHDVMMAARSAHDRNPYRKKCFDVWPSDGLCTVPAGEAKPESLDFLLWGDSHADALMPAVASAALNTGLTGLFAGMSACPPLLGVIRFDKGPNHACKEFNDDVLAFLRSRDDLPVVILAARWALAAEGHRLHGERGVAALLARPGEEPVDPAGNYVLFQESVQSTVEAIRKTGRDIILIGSVPEIGWHVPKHLVEHLSRGVQLPSAPTAKQVERRQKRSDGALVSLAARSGVSFLSLAEEICRPVCRTHHEDGWTFYADANHLSVRGAREVVAPPVQRAFDRLIAQGKLRRRVPDKP